MTKTKPYQVVTTYTAWSGTSVGFDTFSEVLEFSKTAKVLSVSNSYMCDYDHDGLTEDEREQLDAAC